MTGYFGYYSKGLFIFVVPGILTSKRQETFESYIKFNGIENYCILPLGSSLSFSEEYESVHAGNFRHLIDWAKSRQLPEDSTDEHDDLEGILKDFLERGIKKSQSTHKMN